jgi:hypothetical protein
VTDYADIIIDSSLAEQFYGEFRCFLRVAETQAQDSYTLDVGIQGPLALVTTFYHSVTVPSYSTQAYYTIDFGTITLPSVNVTAQDHTNLVLRVSSVRAAGASDTNLFDLGIVPVDEWAAEFTSRSPTTQAETIGLIVPPDNYDYLDVSSLGRADLRALVRTEGDVMVYAWKCIGPRPAILQNNVDQRLYIMTRKMYTTDGIWYTALHTNSVQANRVARYLSMRGAR